MPVLSSCTRHCEERSDEAIHCVIVPRRGLLRGACHRARIRATRWLAMTGFVMAGHSSLPCGDYVNLSALPAIHVVLAAAPFRRGWPLQARAGACETYLQYKTPDGPSHRQH